MQLSSQQDALDTPAEHLLAEDNRQDVLARQQERQERATVLSDILSQATDGGDLYARLSKLDYGLPNDFGQRRFEQMQRDVQELIKMLLDNRPSISSASLSSTQPTPESTEASFEQVGDTCPFFDDGKSIKEMIDENPDTLGGLQWVLDLSGVQKNKEYPCRRTITLAQEDSETTRKTFTQQE